MNTENKERIYNQQLNVQNLTQSETLDPSTYKLLTYSKPKDTCQGILVNLANMSGGFPFQTLGHTWRSVEHLYLLGEWSLSGEKYLEIQKDVLTAPSGYAAKRFKKTKHKKDIRTDFPSFRHQWMLWCVWQKCLGNKDFREHLLSIPEDFIIVELVKNDPIWAAYPNEEGLICGANGMGKILTLCRNCLKANCAPAIDYDLLNRAEIYILGQKIHFSAHL